MSGEKIPYIGRFAPSPTGPLHFGSLVAALASFLDARHHHGQWLVRIEDLDPPRESSAAPEQILGQLQYFGLHWDGDPLFQSHRLSDYESYREKLEQAGHLFHCTCSRKSFGAIYPGTCRGLGLNPTSNESTAQRVNVGDASIQFNDLILGEQHFDLSTEVGDFIIKRKDGLFAYQLAVVVDDHFQSISHVIRGNDLLDSTPRQLYLFQLLGFDPPKYGHFPVVTGDDGAKLSKQAKSPSVAMAEPISVLNQALRALGQPRQETTSVDQLLLNATKAWNLANIPANTGIPLKSLL